MMHEKHISALPSINDSNQGSDSVFRNPYIHARTIEWKGYHDLPERTETAETDRNGPKRTGMDRNGLSWVPKRTLVDTETDRDGPERTETDFHGYRNGLSGYRNGL